MADVIIKSSVKEERSFIYEGKDRKSFYQVAYLNNGDDFPVKFHIPLQDSQQPFPVGDYEWERPNAVLSVNDYNSITINREFNYANKPFPIKLVSASSATPLFSKK